MWISAVESQKKATGWLWNTWKYIKRFTNPWISRIANLIALHSDSADECETVFYFLDFHEVNEFPKNMQ